VNRKPIFDTVRNILGRGFTQEEVDALDEACDRAQGAVAGQLGRGRAAAPPSGGGAGRAVGSRGLELIKSFEGCEKDLPDGRFQAYPDPGSGDGHPSTIGWGSTGPDITPGTVWTKEQCDQRFERDLQRYADAVSRAIGEAPTTQNQFDALVSFHYNTGAIARATLTKKHIQGNYEGARTEFAKWNKNNGRVMKGLVRRRAAEADLYAVS
jgi:lysozyme